MLNDTFQEDKRQATSNTGHVWSWQIVLREKFKNKTRYAK